MGYNKEERRSKNSGDSRYRKSERRSRTVVSKPEPPVSKTVPKQSKLPHQADQKQRRDAESLVPVSEATKRAESELLFPFLLRVLSALFTPILASVVLFAFIPPHGVYSLSPGIPIGLAFGYYALARAQAKGALHGIRHAQSPVDWYDAAVKANLISRNLWFQRPTRGWNDVEWKAWQNICQPLADQMRKGELPDVFGVERQRLMNSDERWVVFKDLGSIKLLGFTMITIGFSLLVVFFAVDRKILFLVPAILAFVWAYRTLPYMWNPKPELVVDDEGLHFAKLPVLRWASIRSVSLETLPKNSFTWNSVFPSKHRLKFAYETKNGAVYPYLHPYKEWYDSQEKIEKLKLELQRRCNLSME